MLILDCFQYSITSLLIQLRHQNCPANLSLHLPINYYPKMVFTQPPKGRGMPLNRDENKGTNTTAANMNRPNLAADQARRSAMRTLENKRYADDKPKDSAAARARAMTDQVSMNRETARLSREKQISGEPHHAAFAAMKLVMDRKSAAPLTAMGRFTQGQRSSENGTTSSQKK